MCHHKTWGMVSGLGWGEEDARVTCRQLQFSVEGMPALYSTFIMFSFNVHILLQVSILIYTLILPLANLDELFTSVLFNVLEVNQESLIVRPTTNYTYEQGKLLAEHLPVAGVTCKHYCLISSPPPVEITKTQYVTSVCSAIIIQQHNSLQQNLYAQLYNTIPYNTMPFINSEVNV